jgi:superfamily II DNA or RNA helicase
VRVPAQTKPLLKEKYCMSSIVTSTPPSGVQLPVFSRCRAKEIELRDYQKDLVGKVYQGVRDEKLRQLLVIIMGAGKTVISGWMIRDAVGKGYRCLFLVALNVLLEQTARELQSLGVDCTILQGDRKLDLSAPVVVASCQTIAARVRKHGPQVLDTLLGPLKLIVVDEAHNTAYMDAYDTIDRHYPEAIVLGLTATPWRLSRDQWLGQKFDHLITGPQPPDIVAMGAAVPCRCFTITWPLRLADLKPWPTL